MHTWSGGACGVCIVVSVTIALALFFAGSDAHNLTLPPFPLSLAAGGGAGAVLALRDSAGDGARRQLAPHQVRVTSHHHPKEKRREAPPPVRVGSHTHTPSHFFNYTHIFFYTLHHITSMCTHVHNRYATRTQAEKAIAQNGALLRTTASASVRTALLRGRERHLYVPRFVHFPPPSVVAPSPTFYYPNTSTKRTPPCSWPSPQPHHKLAPSNSTQLPLSLHSCVYTIQPPVLLAMSKTPSPTRTPLYPQPPVLLAISENPITYPLPPPYLTYPHNTVPRAPGRLPRDARDGAQARGRPRPQRLRAGTHVQAYEVLMALCCMDCRHSLA